MIEIYDEKENLNTNPSVAETNKVTADNMNQLRNAVLNGVYIGTTDNYLKGQAGNQLDPAIPRYEEKNYMVAYLNGNQSIYYANDLIFNMATADSEGDYFELDSTNHQIKVLKDCVAILSGALFVDGSLGDNYILAKIFVNDTQVTSNLARIINRDYTTCSIPAKVVSLKANDVIQMKVDYTSPSGNPSIRASHYSSFVSVAKL